jgi:CRP/FNR family transcriptional regulator
MPNYPQSELVRKLFTKGQPLTYPKNEVIIGNDSVPNGVYYIGTGYIKIYAISNEGNQNLHLILGQGEVFPIIWAYLEIQPELLYYETISECTLWRISKDWFTEYVHSDLALCNAMSLQLANQFRIYADRLDNLEYKKAYERVIYRLLFLASRFGVRESNKIRIEAPITHELFANSINLARESVSREVEKLEKRNLVQQVNNHLVINDVAALAGMLSQPISLKNWHLL